MHISIDQVGEVADREDSAVERFIDRMDLRANPRHIAGVLVRRGLVRLPWWELVDRAPTAEEHKAVQDELVVRLSCIALADEARTGAAWVRAARKAVKGWRPSRWTTVEKAEGVQHVQVKRLD